MNLAELYTELERHDWFHAMSDSAEVHERGDANWNRLKSEADKIPGGLDLMTNYAKHVFSGEPFGTPKAPKPEMPCGECGGTGGVDSGGMTPQGAGIDVACLSCKEQP